MDAARCYRGEARSVIPRSLFRGEFIWPRSTKGNLFV